MASEMAKVCNTISQQQTNDDDMSKAEEETNNKKSNKMEEQTHISAQHKTNNLLVANVCTENKRKHTKRKMFSLD